MIKKFVIAAFFFLLFSATAGAESLFISTHWVSPGSSSVSLNLVSSPSYLPIMSGALDMNETHRFTENATSAGFVFPTGVFSGFAFSAHGTSTTCDLTVALMDDGQAAIEGTLTDVGDGTEPGEYSSSSTHTPDDGSVMAYRLQYSACANIRRVIISIWFTPEE